MSASEPVGKSQETDSQSSNQEILAVNSSSFRGFLPEEEEQVNQLLESAHTYAEKFNELNTLIKQAETEYRSMHKNAALNDSRGYEDINWTNMNESHAALMNFETRINEKLDEIEEHSEKDDRLKAVKEGLWTYTGTQAITIPENEYVQFDVDYDKVADIRSYSNGLVNKNPAPNPLSGHIDDYSEKEGKLFIMLDTENRYGTLQRLEEGETLEDIFDDTEMAEKEQSSVEKRKKYREAREKAEKYDNPVSYEGWMQANDIDRELDKGIGEGRTRGIY